MPILSFVGARYIVPVFAVMQAANFRHNPPHFWRTLSRLCIIPWLHRKLGNLLRTHKNANAPSCRTGESFMTLSNHYARNLSLLVASICAFSFSLSAFAQYTTTLPSDSPAQLKPATDSFNYTRREVMIPMRDGVKLHTVILIPKGARSAPILLTRTPYNADALTSHSASSHMGPELW